MSIAGPQLNLSDGMSSLISFRKSTSPQNRQRIVYYDLLKYYADGCVGELTFENSATNTLCQVRSTKKARENAEFYGKDFVFRVVPETRSPKPERENS